MSLLADVGFQELYNAFNDLKAPMPNETSPRHDRPRGTTLCSLVLEITVELFSQGGHAAELIYHEYTGSERRGSLAYGC